MPEEVKNFWETNIEDLPWAIKINDDTKIHHQWIEYTQNEMWKWVDHILKNNNND